MARAGDYVLGLMQEAERARAERDLEIDPGFRDAVLRVAERMHLLDLKPIPEAASADAWRVITARIAELPQMHSLQPPDPAPASNTPRPGAIVQAPAAKLRHVGLHSVPNIRAGIIAAGLIAACAAGYVAGVATARLW
jgi:hypothetical protein